MNHDQQLNLDDSTDVSHDAGAKPGIVEPWWSATSAATYSGSLRVPRTEGPACGISYRVVRSRLYSR